MYKSPITNTKIVLGILYLILLFFFIVYSFISFYHLFFYFPIQPYQASCITEYFP